MPLSHAPLLYSDKMVLWFANLSAAKTLGQRAGTFLKLQPAQVLKPVIAIMKGLTDPMVGLLMGQTAEECRPSFPASHAATWTSSPRKAIGACCLLRRRVISNRKLCRSTIARANSTPPMTACAKTLRRITSPSSDRFSIASTATSPRATVRRSPTGRRGWCSRPRPPWPNTICLCWECFATACGPVSILH